MKPRGFFVTFLRIAICIGFFYFSSVLVLLQIFQCPNYIWWTVGWALATLLSGPAISWQMKASVLRIYDKQSEKIAWQKIHPALVNALDYHFYADEGPNYWIYRPAWWARIFASRIYVQINTGSIKVIGPNVYIKRLGKFRNLLTA